MKEIFANGTEYDYFIETFCEQCKKYGDFFAGEKPCPIEDKMNSAMMDADEFPHEQVFLGDDGAWTCTGFERQEADDR